MEIPPVYDAELIKGVLRVSVFTKPIKNKLVNVILGSKPDDYFQSKTDVDNVSKALADMVQAEPKNFSNVTFLVTDPKISFRSFDIDKLRHSLTFFFVGCPEKQATDEERDDLEAKLKVVYEALKIPTTKYVVMKYPVYLERSHSAKVIHETESKPSTAKSS